MSKLIFRRVRFRRLREIALLLEKFVIFAAIALLTYALIVLDTRAAVPDGAGEGCLHFSIDVHPNPVTGGDYAIPFNHPHR